MLELQFRADYSIGDGRWKRNAWMQECPDPITGVSWAASAQVSPATFLRLGGSDSRPMHCTLTAPSTQMEVILCPIPGVADNLIILPLGYGGINHVAERQEIPADMNSADRWKNGSIRHCPGTDCLVCPPGADGSHSKPRCAACPVLPASRSVPRPASPSRRGCRLPVENGH